MVVADDGCRLWTSVGGSGPPVILVHGGPGWWDMFGGLADLLSDVSTVYRWDQRGSGRSDRLGPYTFARFLADLDVVRAASGHEQVTVLGHSFGATLALRYALAHPARVARLLYVSGVGLDGPVPGYRERADAIMTAEAHEDVWLARVSLGFADRRTAMAQARALTTPRFAANTECAEALVAEKRAWANPVAACRNLTVPTVVVHGALDLRPPSVTDSLIAALPDVTRVIIDGAAHYPWIENPQAFRQAVCNSRQP